MYACFIKGVALSAIALTLTACSTPRPEIREFGSLSPPASLGRSEVLACIGRKIDNSPGPPMVLITSGRIVDQTAPPHSARGSGLTWAGDSFVRTAIAGMRSRKVSLYRYNTGDEAARLTALQGVLLLEGGFTQADRRQFGAAWDGKIAIGDLTLQLGADAEFELIAADLHAFEQGRLVDAAATAIVLKSGSRSADVVMDGTQGGGAVSFSERSSEGRHLSQRRALELGLAYLLAGRYRVDIRPCLPAKSA